MMAVEAGAAESAIAVERLEERSTGRKRTESAPISFAMPSGSRRFEMSWLLSGISMP
jgi:hypothetical protein